MKGSIAGIFFLLVWTGFASCRKNNATESKACIERLVLLPGDLPVDAPPIIAVDPITEGQIDTIKTLFTNNNLLFNQYQFLYYIYQPWSCGFHPAADHGQSLYKRATGIRRSAGVQFH